MSDMLPLVVTGPTRPTWRGLFDSNGSIGLVTTRQTHIGHQHWTMSC